MECVGHLLISFVCLVGFWSAEAEDRENGLIETFPVHVFADENQLTEKRGSDQLHVTSIVVILIVVITCSLKDVI